MRRVSIAVLGIVVLAVAGAALYRERAAILRSPYISSVLPAPTYRAARAHFPYSVIPGGVLNSRELTDSITRDPVVRVHYQDLNPNHLLPARMPRATMAYVSYRKGNDVRWTKNKVVIPAGELVLSDGQNYVRARCGNRVKFYSSPEASAEAKRTPIPPVEDPPVDVMEAGVPAVMEMARLTPPVDPGIANGPITPIVPPGGGGPPVNYWPPVVPPPVWCCSTGPEPPPPPPGPVPEPSTLLLIATGLGAIATRLKK